MRRTQTSLAFVGKMVTALQPSFGTGIIPVACKLCGSENQRSFNGEVGIHHPGREGLDKPLVFVFSVLVVCLNCGFAEFNVPEPQLQQLGKHAPATA
jgi:hypothetical protein